MVINLATIDFCPSNGGGEAVIRPLDVTENGTYRAPSGVDGYSPVRVNVSGGGSITPEEQAALDTLVDSSGGVLYTEEYVPYMENNKTLNIYGSIYNVCWNDIYMIGDSSLYKLNRETYKFDYINRFDNFWTGPVLFEDKSGRLYWNGYELDLENGTMAQTSITLPETYEYSGNFNILYGEYGVWILGYSYAYKFNESTQEFEQKELRSSFSSTGVNTYLNLFKYDGHILGVYDGKTFEVTEYEDHIEVSDVTGDYFNMGSYNNQFGFRTTSDGDLYYINQYNFNKYDKTSGEWIDVQISDLYYPIYQESIRVSDNFIFSVYPSSPYVLVWINLGSSYKITSWMNPNEHMVDLTSNQTIRGNKNFNGTVNANQYVVNDGGSIFSENGLRLTSNGEIYNVGRKISFANNLGKETLLKNGSKQIATVDQTFINSTFVPYGLDGDNIGYVSGSEFPSYNFNTYTNRYFKKYNDAWYEFDGTTTLIPVSFTVNNFDGNNVFSSPSATIMFNYDETAGEYRTNLWDDTNTDWIDICPANNVGSYGIWFDGSNIRYQNTYILVETGGVWSWESDPLPNNVWDGNYAYGYKNGEVYAYNNSDWHLYKYDSVQCTMIKIGFTNAGNTRLYSYFNEIFFEMNGGNVYFVDLSKVDPNDPDKFVLSDSPIFNNYNTGFIGATDRLYHYFRGEMYSSYSYIYEFPEVPGSDGTYTLKAVRVGDQITYGWELDV